jgi:hypothetical protein
MTKFEALILLAANAPNPDEAQLSFCRQQDKMRNPHNEAFKPKLRDTMEIIADYKLAFAIMMHNKIVNDCK